MPRIAIARFAHEGNSFASVRATRADFEAFEWADGTTVDAIFRGTNTEIGGTIRALERHPEWQPTFLRCTFATPSGEVERETFETIMAEILAGLQGEKWDAVFLPQHGAMQVVGIEHADHEILRRVREVVGAVPLGVSYDLHANITPAQLALVDIAVAYKCHPHTDMADTADKAVELLLRRAEGKIAPVVAYRRLPTFIPSINARTTDGPMAEAVAFARGVAQLPDLLDVSIYQGYVYGDRAYAGGSIVVYADGNQAAAERAADLVLAETVRIFPRLFVAMPDAEEGLRRAKSLIAAGQRPVAVLDAADHPGAGANADTPGLLRAVLALDDSIARVFAFLWDPETVAAATAAGVGATIDVRLGARLTEDFGPPVVARAKVLLLTDGDIVNSGPFQHGLAYHYGRTAVLEVGVTRIILTEQCLTVSDPAFFALHEIDLSRIDLLAMKAKNQFRAAFESVFAELIAVDVPGPAAYDFSLLPFRNVPIERRRMATVKATA